MKKTIILSAILLFSLTSCIKFNATSYLEYDMANIAISCQQTIEVGVDPVTFQILIPDMDIPFSITEQSDWFSISTEGQSPSYSAEPYILTVTIIPIEGLASDSTGTIEIRYGQVTTNLTVHFSNTVIG